MITFHKPSHPVTPPRPRSARHSSKYKARRSEEREDDDGREAVSEDESQHRSVSSEDTISPTVSVVNVCFKTN